MTHILPSGEEDLHEMTERCQCGPTVDFEDGEPLVVHRTRRIGLMRLAWLWLAQRWRCAFARHSWQWVSARARLQECWACGVARKAGRGMALALAVALYWSAMAMIALAALALQRWRA